MAFTVKDISYDQREMEKFGLNSDGNIFVRTSVSGTLTPTGLAKGLHTEVTINKDTWTELPTNSLAKRSALNIQNFTGVEIKVNHEPDAPGDIDNLIPNYTGMRVGIGLERFYAFKDERKIYAKSKTAPTETLDVEEVASEV